MTTTKGQLAQELKNTGEAPESLACFYRAQSGEYQDGGDGAPIFPIRCSFDELPERKFDAGYGGTEGEPCIAFGEKYIYIKVQYDGMEWFTAIPRHPEHLGEEIPWPGG